MSRIIIAFAGYKGSGKTTAFEIVKNKYSEVYEVTLAKHLKTVLSQVFEIPINYFKDPNLKDLELENEVYLEKEQIASVIKAFNKEPIYDTQVRPFMGKVLYTPRTLMQFIGTEILHKIDPLIHTKYAVSNMPDSGTVIVTDIRFYKEFLYFEENFKKEFNLFYINNLNAETLAYKDKHSSEKELDFFKSRGIYIDNNGYLEDFKINVLSHIRRTLEQK